jgi:uncharacterized protein (DUF1499 family)
MKVLKFTVYSVLGLVVLGVAGLFILGMMSQNGSAPGLVDGRLSPCPDSPNCVSSEVGTAPSKATEPLPLEAWEKLSDVIATQGGTVTSETEDYISAEFKSAVFGFVDDVEFSRSNDVVHLRSASRVGYSDGGANATRVAGLRSAVGDE